MTLWEPATPAIPRQQAFPRAPIAAEAAPAGSDRRLIDAVFTVRYTLPKRRIAIACGVYLGGVMPHRSHNPAHPGCAMAEPSFPFVQADGQRILSRAKLSALRSRGKSLAGYSPPRHTR